MSEAAAQNALQAFLFLVYAVTFGLFAYRAWLRPTDIQRMALILVSRLPDSPRQAIVRMVLSRGWVWVMRILSTPLAILAMAGTVKFSIDLAMALLN